MKITAFERRNQKLAPTSVFVKRQIISLAIGIAMLGCALFIGIAGYHWIAGLDWFDSLLEASRIFGGMGPINPIETSGAKVCASIYALFMGAIFIVLIAITLTPFVTRISHKFHV